MSYDQLYAVLNPETACGEIYGADKVKALYDALQNPDTDIEQLTCEVCGLPEWQGDVSDMAQDFARESDDPPSNLDDPDSCVEWYLENHNCAYHSPFSDVHVQSWRDRDRHEAEIAAIEDAISPDNVAGIDP